MSKTFTLLAIVLLTFVSANVLHGQEESYFTKQVIAGDTITTLELAQVTVFTKRTFDSLEDEREFERLKRKVIKVYPYVKMAGQIYDQIESDMDSIGKRRKEKKYLKTTEKDLRDRFEVEIKNLTRSQGRILVALINRETGNNCYKLIKELKSPVAAFFWNIVGKKYDYHLKEEYNADTNPDLEYIISMLESGQEL